jgi:glycosyltransferase involved in cell wall biosynthesis
VGLPVFNGEDYVRAAIVALLGQTFTDFELIVSDNGSGDATEGICRELARQDRRVTYTRSPKNRGASWNYSRVFELATGEYFKWAAHDDVCRPEFLRRCVEVLDREPEVVLCFTQTLTIDRNSDVIKQWGHEPDLGTAPAPHARYRQFLEPFETHLVWGLIRRDVLARTALLGPYPSHDMPLLAELALHGEFRQVPEALFCHREHAGRSVRAHDFRDPHEAIVWYDPGRASHIAYPHWRLLAEYARGARRAPLDRRERMACYRELLGWTRRRRSSLGADLVVAAGSAPGAGASIRRAAEWLDQRRWQQRVRRAVDEIDAVARADSPIVLIDDAALAISEVAGRRALPFLEHDGRYDGPPPDDATAIRELERLRADGAATLVVAWPAFWYLEHYDGLRAHLDASARRVLESDLVVVYALDPPPGRPSATSSSLGRTTR